MADETVDVLKGLEGFTPGPWHWSSNRPSPYGYPVHAAIGVSPHCRPDEGDHIGNIYREANAHLIARAPDLVTEIQRLRTALETLFPAEEGFTEAMDDLIRMGLLVEVPADDAYREEWDAETMYVWAWSELAGGSHD